MIELTTITILSEVNFNKCVTGILSVLVIADDEDVIRGSPILRSLLLISRADRIAVVNSESSTCNVIQ